MSREIVVIILSVPIVLIVAKQTKGISIALTRGMMKIKSSEFALPFDDEGAVDREFEIIVDISKCKLLVQQKGDIRLSDLVSLFSKQQIVKQGSIIESLSSGSKSSSEAKRVQVAFGD